MICVVVTTKQLTEILIDQMSMRVVAKEVVQSFDGEDLRLIHRKRDLEFEIVSPDHRKQRFVRVSFL